MAQEEQQSRCLSANILLSLSITFEFSKEDYALRRTLIPHIVANKKGVQTGISIPYDDDQCTRFGLALNENGLWKDAERLFVQGGNAKPDTLSHSTLAPLHTEVRHSG